MGIVLCRSQLRCHSLVRTDLGSAFLKVKNNTKFVSWVNLQTLICFLTANTIYRCFLPSIYCYEYGVICFVFKRNVLKTKQLSSITYFTERIAYVLRFTFDLASQLLAYIYERVKFGVLVADVKRKIVFNFWTHLPIVQNKICEIPYTFFILKFSIYDL